MSLNDLHRRLITVLTGAALFACCPLIALGAGGGISPYAAAVLADNPIAYWQLNELSLATVAADDADDPLAPQSGAQDGEYEAGAVLGSAGPSEPAFPGFGAGNIAPDFTSGAVAIDDMFDVLDTLRPSAITMEAWIKNDTLSGRQVIYKNHISELSNGFALFLEDNEIQMAARSTPTDNVNTTNAIAPFNTTAQWRHVVGIVDYANDEMRIYVDGVLAAEVNRAFDASSYSPTGTPATAPDYIGRVPLGSRFLGLIDEVAVYDRALSDAEILEHYYIALGQSFVDCNTNGIDDSLDIDAGTSEDCNQNTVPDECDISGGTSADVNTNGQPDECFAPYSEAVSDSNPIAYWRLGELSLTGAANDDATDPLAPQLGDQDGDYEGGAIQGLAGPSEPEFPGFGVGNVSPDFTNGAVAINDMFDALDTLRPPAITMEAWIKNDSLSGRQVIYKNHISQQLNGFALFLEDNEIRVAARSTPTDNGETTNAPFNTTAQWRHVVGIVDYANDEMRIYVDGVLAVAADRAFGASSYSPTGTPATAPDYIGRVVPGSRFNGQIDEVAVYDRALSDAEIIQHYYIAVGQPFVDCNENGIIDGVDIAVGTSSDCNQNTIPDECDIAAGTSTFNDCNTNGVLDECDIAGITSTDVNSNGAPDDCETDVRIVAVPVVVDPATTTPMLGAEPTAATSVNRGSTFWVEVWVSDIGGDNTGLTSVYVDLAFCAEASPVDLDHGSIFTTFTSGTIVSSGVDEFGGSALPNGGGISPQWVRVGWVEMATSIENPSCAVDLSPAALGVAAFGRGTIPPELIEFESATIDITEPSVTYDLDGSGFIDIGDLSFFALSWLMSVPPGDPAHDFDCDGSVGPADLSWFATGWQKFTTDPTILFAPTCPGGAFTRVDNFVAETDVDFRVILLSAPSGFETTQTLPSSVTALSESEPFFVEIWVSDVGATNTGVVSAYVDLSYPVDAVSVTNVSHGSLFTAFTSGVELPGVIDELGGSALPGTDGVEPQWARVAVVQMEVYELPASMTFGLEAGSIGISANSRGAIAPENVSLDGVSIQTIGIPGDFDGDGDIDLDDYVYFTDCLNGPDAAPNPTLPATPQDCIDAFDIDGGGDVDLSDFAEFTRAIAQ